MPDVFEGKTKIEREDDLIGASAGALMAENRYFN